MFDDMTPDQIRQVIVDAEAELAAREAVDAAERAVTDAVAAYAVAADCTVLQAWRALAPEGVDVPEDPAPEPGPDAPEFMQPTGAHDSYALGDLVTFQGRVYRSLIAGNAYSPLAYPQGWEAVA